MNASGSPGKSWLLCAKYVCFVMNRLELKSLNWRTPIEVLTRTTPDISMIYHFKFWDPVFFLHHDTDGKSFPSQSNEEKGRFVGFSENVGHQMTYLIYKEETGSIIYCSRIKLSNLGRNLRIDPSV